MRSVAFLSRCAQSSYLRVLFRIGNRRKLKVIEKHSDNCINGQHYFTNLKFINAKALSQPIFIETNLLNIFCAFSKLCRKLKSMIILRGILHFAFLRTITNTITTWYFISFFDSACTHPRGCVLVGRMIKILVYSVYIIAPRSYPTREILF